MKWWNNFCVQIRDMLMSFNCRCDRVNADENSFPLILPCAASRPGWPRARAASFLGRGGRATVVKLQTDREFQCSDVVTTFRYRMSR